MKFKTFIGIDTHGAIWVRRNGITSKRPAFSVGEACVRLRRTRRQVYRMIESGTIENYGKFLGEWLLDTTSVERLSRAMPSVHPIPKRFKHLFPEYDLVKVNVGLHRELILSRFLELGDQIELQWMRRRYTRKIINDFIMNEGSKRLTPRALRFWSLFYKVRRLTTKKDQLNNPWNFR